MPSYFPMVKNSVQRIVFPIRDADGDPVTGAAGDTPDSEYSLDGGSFADLADEIHELATSSGVYYLDLSADETNGDVVCIQVKTATAGTTVLVFYTAAEKLPTLAEIADAVWDEALTGASHNLGNSAGKRLRQVSGEILRQEDAQAGDNLHITLDSGASSVNDFYLYSTVAIIGGTGIGQARHIMGYVGNTKVAEVYPAWKTNPASGSEFVIIGTVVGHTHMFEVAGLAQINAEIVDVLGTDILAELSQGIPAKNPTIKAALMLLYMIARNQLTTTNTELGIYNDAGTKIAKKTIGDDGVTYTEEKMESGI